MHRRSYLLLSAGALFGSAGCLGNSDGRNVDSTLFAGTDQFETDGDDERSTHSFDGEGADDGDERTDTFELTADGPTVVEYDHDGEESFTVWFVDENGERVAPGYSAQGPFEGQTIHALEPDTYGLTVEADGEWSLTVHDLPVYTSGRSLPIETDGMLTDVIGPIEFPDGEAVSFTVSAANSPEHGGLLFDRHGELGPQVFGLEGDVEDETISGAVSGIGYLFVESGGTWEITIE